MVKGMRRRIVIVDGYNIIHGVPALAAFLSKGLEQARQALVRRCAGLMSRRHDVWRYCLVFDGDSTVRGMDHMAAAGVEMIFTRSGETADDRILAILDQRIADCDCTVVSNDVFVKSQSRLRKATIVSAAAFAGMSTAGGRETSLSPDSDPKNRLSAAARHAIDEELRREWGVK